MSGVVLSREYGRSLCVSALLVCAGCLVLAGCGSAKHPPIYRVSGELFVKGEPAGGARLTLQPEVVSDPKLWPMGYPSAIVQPDGKFQFTSYKEGDGAPEGTYKLLAKWDDSDGIPNEDPDAPPPMQKIDPKYADPASSPWAVTVEKKANKLTRFEVP
jgi:hypothetical protein